VEDQSKLALIVDVTWMVEFLELAVLVGVVSSFLTPTPAFPHGNEANSDVKR
jgi:hypothetical protein